MRKILLVVIASIMLMVGLASPSTASGAALDVRRDGPITKYEGCNEYPFAYDVPDFAAAAAGGWDLTITFRDPTGLTSDSSYLYDAADPSSGQTTAYICGDEPVGTWSLVAELEWYDSHYNVQRQSISRQFTVLKSSTGAAVAVNDNTARYRQRLTFTVAATRTFPNGWFADPGAPVLLQKFVRGQWRTFASGAVDGNGQGSVTLRWKHRKKVNVRAVREETEGSYQSISPEITIY